MNLAYNCPLMWSLHGTSCYGYYSFERPWNDAEALCNGSSGHLVSIATKAENTFVKSLVPRGSNAWIGLHDPQMNNEHVSSNGNAVDYTNWKSGEPTDNRKNDQNCVYMKKNG